MPIPLSQLCGELTPEKTVLFFGAGSSLPSKAPSVDVIKNHFGKRFDVDPKGYSLAEIAGIGEAKTNRYEMITALRALFENIRPIGGILNLPLYNWKSIFTTNYDKVIEDGYRQQGSSISVFSSDFDFTMHGDSTSVKLFKVHGTIDKDVCDGIQSRIIITDLDYDYTQVYRQSLFDRLKADLAGAHLVIIGYSLADPDIKDIVTRAAAINQQTTGASGRITLLLYVKDEDRARLYENRGIQICFGGVDDFFAEYARTGAPVISKATVSDNPVSRIAALVPVTVDVWNASDSRAADVSAMFNGRPASYADVNASLTFHRTIVSEIDTYLRGDGVLTATIVGASGVGKTTASRQLLTRFMHQGKYCWEHAGDHPLSVTHWEAVMESLRNEGKEGVLFIDDTHSHLQQVNDLIDRAVANDNAHLKFVFASTRNHWYPRIKTPNIFKYGKEWHLSQLKNEEIEGLLQLIEVSDRIRPLIEPVFSGFSKQERRRRLIDRCEKDFFVCLKNIFASESMDDIILKEFASLDKAYSDVYRYVAAMENAGIRVHRQLIIRLLGISASFVSSVLDNLKDIITEYDVDPKEGIFGWRTRHSVVAGIVTKYKFSDIGQTIDLFEKVITSINPTFPIEIRTIRELCNVDTGLPRIPDKKIQNRLLREMISAVPGERVPRHRLIRNLIEMGAFEQAEAEMRVFQNDFKVSDGPVHRYKINLMVARAVRTPDLLLEDRVAILEQAQEIAVAAVDRYYTNKHVLSAYAELGIEYYKLTGRLNYYDDALLKLKIAEEVNGDPEISRVIARLERRMSGQCVAVDAGDPD